MSLIMNQMYALIVPKTNDIF